MWKRILFGMKLGAILVIGLTAHLRENQMLAQTVRTWPRERTRVIMKNSHPSKAPHAVLTAAKGVTSSIEWGPVMKLSPDDPWPSGGNFTPQLLTQGDTIYGTWVGGEFRLPFIRSTNGGLVWEQPKEILTDPQRFTSVGGNHFVSDGKLLYLFFAGTDTGMPGGMGFVFFEKSSDGGQSWSMPVRAAGDTGAAFWSPSIRGDTVAVVYDPEVNGQVQYPRITRSTDGGTTWTKNPFRMPSSSSNQLRVALTPGLLNFFHPGDMWPGPAPEIVLHRSTDLADTWKDSVVLSPIDTSGSDMPEVATYEYPGCNPRTTIGVMWRGEEFGGAWFSAGMALCLSYDNGVSWQPMQVVSDVPFGSFHSIAIRANVVALSWTHEGSDFGGPFQTKVRVSLDDGQTWGSVANLTPQPSAWANVPSIALSNSAVHVAWEELIHGKWNIYYCRGNIARPPVRGIQISYEPGWNLLSLPVIADSSYSLPSLFAYNKIYVKADTMVTGKGYWAKPAEFVDYVGSSFLAETISVNARWNMIGGLSAPLAAQDVQSIPPGLVVSPFYGFNCNGYFVADTLYHGMGYWVKVKQDAQLVLALPGIVPLSAHVRIVPDDEMPPPVPEGGIEEERDQHGATPQTFGLSQNHPNPFNPVTDVRFEIADVSIVTLKVYDLLGREVAVLVDEMKEPGTYNVQWKAENHPSGIYFCRLISYGQHQGPRTDTKKMLVVR